MRYIHVQINMQYNENTYGWSDPKTRKDIDFSIPCDLLEPKRVTDVIALAIKEMEAEFPLAVAKYEAEQAEKLAKEEAEKAENVVLTPA